MAYAAWNYYDERVKILYENELKKHIAAKPALIKEIRFAGAFMEIMLETENNLLKAVVLNDGKRYREKDRVYVSYELIALN